MIYIKTHYPKHDLIHRNKPAWCSGVIYFGPGPPCRCFLIAIM